MAWGFTTAGDRPGTFEVTYVGPQGDPGAHIYRVTCLTAVTSLGGWAVAYHCGSDGSVVGYNNGSSANAPGDFTDLGIFPQGACPTDTYFTFTDRASNPVASGAHLTIPLGATAPEPTELPVPTNLTASCAVPLYRAIQLEWDGAPGTTFSDGALSTGYEVFRNGKFRADAQDSTYKDGVADSAEHQYTVRAFRTDETPDPVDPTAPPLRTRVYSAFSEPADGCSIVPPPTRGILSKTEVTLVPDSSTPWYSYVHMQMGNFLVRGGWLDGPPGDLRDGSFNPFEGQTGDVITQVIDLTNPLAPVIVPQGDDPDKLARIRINPFEALEEEASPNDNPAFVKGDYPFNWQGRAKRIDAERGVHMWIGSNRNLWLLVFRVDPTTGAVTYGTPHNLAEISGQINPVNEKAPSHYQPFLDGSRDTSMTVLEDGNISITTECRIYHVEGNATTWKTPIAACYARIQGLEVVDREWWLLNYDIVGPTNAPVRFAFSGQNYLDSLGSTAANGKAYNIWGWNYSSRPQDPDIYLGILDWSVRPPKWSNGSLGLIYPFRGMGVTEQHFVLQGRDQFAPREIYVGLARKSGGSVASSAMGQITYPTLGGGYTVDMDLPGTDDGQVLALTDGFTPENPPRILGLEVSGASVTPVSQTVPFDVTTGDHHADEYYSVNAVPMNGYIAAVIDFEEYEVPYNYREFLVLMTLGAIDQGPVDSAFLTVRGGF